jgi:hypothetical protein
VSNGWRLHRLRKRVPPSADTSDEARVAAAFNTLFDRLEGDDRALVRDFSRHQRAVGIEPDMLTVIMREAFVACFGFAFEVHGGESVRVQRAPRRAEAFLDKLVMDARRWRETHGATCTSCDAAMAARRAGWDRTAHA